MSTLEERREARRRRRQQEADETELNGDDKDDLEARLNRRRKEREERLKRISAGLNAINGEDELERRRRERRDQRLRSGEAPEETTSRRSRRRAEEEETEESSYTSSRSRRRRGYEEEVDSAPAEEPQVDPEEEARKRRAAQAEQERLEAEEQLRREEAAEERKRQQEAEAERKRQEEERRRREDEERARREALEYELEKQQKERDQHETRINERIHSLQTEQNHVNDDLFIDEESWNNSYNSDYMERRRSENPKTSQLKTFFEDRMEENKVNENHIEIHRRDSSNRRNNSYNQSLDESGQSNVQERLIKFQNSLQNSQKEPPTKEYQVYQAKVLSPGTDRLKDIQKRFEGEKAEGDLALNRLGRLSASESHLNMTEKFDTPRSGTKKVLNRWQPSSDSQKPFYSHNKPNGAYNENGHQIKRSGAITQLASKFSSSKESLNDSGVTSPVLRDSGTFRDMSSVRRQWSLISENSEKPPESSSTLKRNKSLGSKVADRWQFDKQENLSSSGSRPVSAPSVRDKESNAVTPVKLRQFSSSSDDRQNDFVVVATPVTITSNGWHRTRGTYKEEEERLERERLEKEEAEREAAAKRMEEEQKKRSKKRKGLGGLDKEKKNKLKETFSDTDSADDEDEGSMESDSSRQSSLKSESRVAPLPSDMDSMSKADLIKLCKNLHSLVATLEEELYDWNMKIRKQEFEINSLSLKINDSKGKFVKPVLRKVNKESKFEKLKKDKSDFRGNLKSTGQSKYALDEEGEEKAE